MNVQSHHSQWDSSEKDLLKIESRPGYNYKELFRELCKKKEEILNGEKIILTD